jgi:hypothetical protein
MTFKLITINICSNIYLFNFRDPMEQIYTDNIPISFDHYYLLKHFVSFRSIFESMAVDVETIENQSNLSVRITYNDAKKLNFVKSNYFQNSQKIFFFIEDKDAKYFENDNSLENSKELIRYSKTAKNCLFLTKNKMTVGDFINKNVNIV